MAVEKNDKYYFKKAIIAYYMNQNPFLSKDDLEEKIKVNEIGMSLPADGRAGLGNITAYFEISK